MSNRDRIQHAAAEAQAADAEKAAKKAAKPGAKNAAKKATREVGKKATKKVSGKASGGGSRAAAKGGRMKVVWAIFNSQGKAIESFAYPDRDAAVSRARELSATTSRPHEVRDAKVPMEATD
jgi:hypothetical protein